MNQTILEQLNPDQVKPVTDTEGAVLVLAGAGSGKTRVLTSRIAYLIEEKGAFPDQILAITFTNKAANEMKERLSSMVDVDGMWISTIHSMCVRMLRTFPESVGYDKNFSIYAESERAAVLKKTFRTLGEEDEKLFKKVQTCISEAKTEGLDPDDYYAEKKGMSDIDIVYKVYTLYQKHLKQNNALDFDDLLLEALRLLRTDREALDYFSGKFRYILVDEFQDTNSVQFDIVKYLASVHGNLFVVGDDDQSIYGWRGAKIENILSFQKTYPAAKVYKLEQNYRSTKTILSLANEVIAHNGKRNQKTLWTENPEGEEAVYHAANEEEEEALYAAKTIRELVDHHGYRYSDFAVLMRVNALTRSYESEFAKYAISFKVFGGFKFFERKEIKDILAYFRIIANPLDNEAVTRIINFPKRGIGDKTVQALEAYASREGISLYDALFELDDIGFNSGTKGKLQLFCDLLKDIVLQGQTLPLRELVRYVVAATKMRSAYDEKTDEGDSKLQNVDEFISSIDEYAKLNPDSTVSDYLSQVTLSTDTDAMDESDYVTVATIHAVKGLEFRQVFLCGLEQKIFPTERALREKDGMEEERRLMYVAITRAREKIYFTRSRSRFLYGKRDLTAVSPFLKELSIDLGDDAHGYAGYGGYGSYGRSERYGGYDSYGSGYGNAAYGRGASDYGETFGSSPSMSSSSGSSFVFGSSSAIKKRETGDQTSSYGSYGSRSVADEETVFGSGKRREGGKVPLGSALSSVSADKSKNVYACKVGVRIRHPKFGEGTIVGTKGAGGNLIINVDFGSLGVKQLSAALAPIEVIE